MLVTGSRIWTDRKKIYDRLKRYPKGTILIHGGADGADTIAAEIGRELGFEIHCYPYFRDLKRRGGHERNRCMFGALLNAQRFSFDCYVEAFPKGEAKGTRGCLRIVDTWNEKNPARRIPWSAIYDEKEQAQGQETTGAQAS